MDTKSIAAILLKITGLLLVVLCVSQLPSYFPIIERGYDFSIGEIVATVGLGLGPLTVLGLVLWFFPGTITNKIVSVPPAQGAIVDVRPIELVALTILGVFLLAHGSIAAIRNVFLLIVMSRQDLGPVPASIVANMAATVAELVIGLTLCIGAKGVSRLLEKMRR